MSRLDLTKYVRVYINDQLHGIVYEEDLDAIKEELTPNDSWATEPVGVWSAAAIARILDSDAEDRNAHAFNGLHYWIVCQARDDQNSDYALQWAMRLLEIGGLHGGRI